MCKKNRTYSTGIYLPRSSVQGLACSRNSVHKSCNKCVWDRSTERERDRESLWGRGSARGSGSDFCRLFHTRFYLGKQGEDVGKEAMSLVMSINAFRWSILVTRKPLNWFVRGSPYDLQGFQRQRRNSKKDPGMRRSQMGTFISLGSSFWMFSELWMD